MAGNTTCSYNTGTGEIGFSGGSPSDARLKTDIVDTALGLKFIKQLRPVEYKWKDRIAQHVIDDIYETLYESTLAKNLKPAPSPGIRIHQGFIAQEVYSVLASTEKDYSIYSREQNPSTILYDLQSVHKDELIAPIVKAIQEQDEVIQAQASTITSMTASLSTLLGLNNLPPL